MADLLPGPPVPLRHPGRWVACVVVVLLLIWAAWVCSTNPNFQWPVVLRYLFKAEILHGVLITLYLTGTAMLIGIALGVLTALMRLSENRLLSTTAQAYIIVFRGTPVLVQLIFWFNLSALFPVIAFGIPIVGPTFFSADANSLITPLVAANLGLGLCEGAYMAEIVRSGILSVDQGQGEAAAAVGMSRAQTMRKIILPQALRVIIPPTANQVIGMLKYTALASVISVTELLASVELIFTRTFETIPLLIVASFWYVVMTTVLTLFQKMLERRVGRSHSDRREGPAVGFVGSVLGNLFLSRRQAAGGAR